jgi:hypothetical protein
MLCHETILLPGFDWCQMVLQEGCLTKGSCLVVVYKQGRWSEDGGSGQKMGMFQSVLLRM